MYLHGCTSSLVTSTPKVRQAILRCLAMCLAACALSSQALSLTGVYSRKAHLPGPGDFDIPIDATQSMSGTITVEPRVIGSGHSIVFQFDGPITSTGNLNVIDDAITTVAGASAAISGTSVVVTIPVLADNRRVTVTLSNINGIGMTASASLGFLTGDVNGTRSVTIADASAVKARSGQAADSTSFRYDLNATGLIGASDISAAKARTGRTMPPGNAAPIVTAGSSQTINLPASAMLAGTVSDDGLPIPPGAVTLTWSVVSGPAGVVFGDTSAANTTAAFSGPGVYILRLTANDGQRTASADVTITANSLLSLSCPSSTAAVGTAYSSPAIAAGGAAPYTYSLQSGALPPPLSLSPGTGLVSGTPTTKGNFSFVVRATDSTIPVAQAATANCSIVVPNRPPVASSQSLTIVEDTPTIISLVAADPDGDSLTFTIVADPAHGSLGAFGAPICSGTPSTCTRSATYMPAGNYNGADSFTFKANDGSADSVANATVTITVNAANDAPVASAKNYVAQANMRLSVSAGSGVLAGASDPDAADAGFSSLLTVGTVSGTTPPGGAVMMNPATGAFDFDPPPGVTGNVTFTFTVCDNGNPLPSVCSAPATVSVNVIGPVIWFVNTAAAAGNGTLLSPFNALAVATAAMGSNVNQRIFVYSGLQALGAGVTLPADGWLVGQGATGASFDAVMGIAPPAGTAARPVIGGVPPTVRGTVSLNGSNTRVQGLNIQPSASSAALIAPLPGPFTGLVVADIANITTTGARAINLNNVSGAFSIGSVNASAADIGINLVNVNPSSGSFAVAGAGGACSSATPTCSGGAISGSTDTAVKLTNAKNITLARLHVTGSGNFGLNGSNVSVLNIDTCLFDGVHGNALDEGALFVTNWLTSGTISNSEILGGSNDNVRVVNDSGILNRLTISNTTIRDNSTGANGNHGLRFATNLLSNTGAGVVMNLTATGSNFRNQRANHIDTGATGLSTMDIVLANNTFSSIATTLSGAVNITGDHQADVTFDVNANSMNGAQLSAFNFFQSNLTTAAASMVGRFRNNIVGTAGVTGSGSAQGNGVSFTSSGLATLTTNITNNQVRQFSTFGIGVSGGDTSPVVNATVTGNIVKEGNTALSLNAINFNMGTTAAGAVTACIDIGGAGALANDVTGAIPPVNGTDLRVRQRNSSVVRMPGYTGLTTDSATIAAFLQGRNPGGTASVTTNITGITGGAPCPQAP